MADDYRWSGDVGSGAALYARQPLDVAMQVAGIELDALMFERGARQARKSAGKDFLLECSFLFLEVSRKMPGTKESGSCSGGKK